MVRAESLALGASIFDVLKTFLLNISSYLLDQGRISGNNSFFMSKIYLSKQSQKCKYVFSKTRLLGNL